MSFSVNRQQPQTFRTDPTDPVKKGQVKKTDPVDQPTVGKAAAKAAQRAIQDVGMSAVPVVGSATTKVSLFGDDNDPGLSAVATSSIVASHNIPLARLPQSVQLAPIFDSPLLNINSIEALFSASEALPADERTKQAAQKVAEKAILAFNQSYN